MAMTFGQKVVSSRIDVLAEQRNHLQSLVHEADEVLLLATSWLKNASETKGFTFMEVNKMIEDTLVLLSGAAFSVGCGKGPMQTDYVTTTSLPITSTFTDQNLPARYGQVSSISAVPDELKTIMSQVKVMQNTLSFLNKSTEKISENQLTMEQCIENLSVKFSKLDQEKIRDIETDLKSISEKQKKTAAQQDKRMKTFDDKLRVMADAQLKFKESQEQQQKTLKKEQKKENERHKKQSQQFTRDLSVCLENIQELNSRICLLENQALIVTDLEALEKKVKFLEINSENMSIKCEEHCSMFEEFIRRTEETLTNLSSGQGREFKRLQKFEEKISDMEMNCSETSQKAGKLYNEVGKKYEMVCHVVADRLAPLERLRDILNEKLDVKKENMKKLDTVCGQMTRLLPKFSQLEKQRFAIGFSACVVFIPVTDTAINSFTNIISNVGKYFNPRTGVFTAPLNGLYATSLSVKSTLSVSLQFSIVKQPCVIAGHSQSCNECKVSRICTDKYDKQASVFVLVNMKAGETLSVTCESATCKSANDTADCIAWFTSFRIG